MMDRILVIDDEKDLLELVGFNLQREGYSVLTTADGREGIELARRQRPDLAILDVHVTALRRKLGKAGAHLQTIRGFGYKLSDQPAEGVAADS